jgi:hypothetical protein
MLWQSKFLHFFEARVYFREIVFLPCAIDNRYIIYELTDNKIKDSSTELHESLFKKNKL